MTKEQKEEIEKAAKLYADKKWVISQRSVNMDGFKAGVNWAMKQAKLKES